MTNDDLMVQQQIDEMYEYTKDYGRSQFVETLVEQEQIIAELKKSKQNTYEKLKKWLNEEILRQGNPKVLSPSYYIKNALEVVLKEIEELEKDKVI